MFGYILNYFANAAKNKQICCKVSIFTETEYNMGWLDFYKKVGGQGGGTQVIVDKPIKVDTIYDMNQQKIIKEFHNEKSRKKS